MNRAGYCWRCRKPCSLRCSLCRVASYCSKECQVKDKWRHKPDCGEAALTRECMGCHVKQEGMKKCSACIRAWYCSTECQRKDLENHKTFCQEIVKKTIHLATNINRLFTITGRDPGLAWTYYWGNTPAVDLINLSMNEGEEYSSPLALLLCGVGDPRNFLLTTASLHDTYKQQVTFVLNDICPCTLARTVLLLYMLNKGKVLIQVEPRHLARGSF